MAIGETVRGKTGRPKKPTFPIPAYITTLPEGEQEIYWQFVKNIESENPDLSIADRFHLHIAALEYILAQRAYEKVMLGGGLPEKNELSQHLTNMYKALDYCSVSRKDRKKLGGNSNDLDEETKRIAGLI